MGRHRAKNDYIVTICESGELARAQEIQPSWINVDGLTPMNPHLKSAAKRLTLSLLAAATLGGCAVYEPGYPTGYAYDPYPYGPPAYSGAPYYVGPPVSLGLWFESRRGGGHRGHYGGRHGHYGGHHGGWGARRH